jgi:putative FmdB family regulatory protein
MPLYEYKCDACGHQFETIQKFSDPPLETCPKCGGKVQKQLSSPAIQFKGSGWYITDYAKKSSDGGGKAAEKKGGGKPDSAKSDARSDSSPSKGADAAKSD